MKVALYARVSTSDQDPEVQLQPLRDYCRARGWEVFQEFTDVGFSGSKDSRPALDELVHAAGQRRFQTLLVWKFDRFARSTIHLLEALRFFQATGVNFVSLTEAIDTTTPVGEMVYTLIAAIAKFERDLNRERTKAGLAKARAAGKHVGRPGLMVTDAEIAAKLQEARDRGEKPCQAKIAKELGVSATWLCRKLRKGLQNHQDEFGNAEAADRPLQNRGLDSPA